MSPQEQTMWFYQEAGHQSGPVGDNEMKRLICCGAVNLRTKVWCAGMDNWLPLSDTGFRALFPKDMPPPIERPRNSSSNAAAKKMLGWWWSMLSACIYLCFIGMCFGVFFLTGPTADGAEKFGESMGIPMLIGFILMIVTCISYCRIIFNLWRLIPPNHAQTTPGKAVGFYFIPFFNIYWHFVAFHGLAKALNRESERDPVRAPRIDENLSLASCILIFCWFIPLVGFIASAIGTVLYFITLRRMIAVGTALIATNA